MKTIRQQATFKARAHDVYEALMDSRKHARFSEMDAHISRKVGGKIRAYGEYIEGENVRLVPDRLIVQKWRASDWPKGHYSRVTFSLKAMKGKTRLLFSQRNVPANDFKNLRQGWKDYYWEKMKAAFGW